MKKLKRPINKMPTGGIYRYKVEGYEFMRNSLEKLVEAVQNYLIDIKQPKNFEELYAEIEHSVCEQNPQIPQYEKL